MFELVKCRPKLIGVVLTQIRSFTFPKYHSHIRSFTYLLALASILQRKITFIETNSHYWHSSCVLYLERLLFFHRTVTYKEWVLFWVSSRRATKLLRISIKDRLSSRVGIGEITSPTVFLTFFCSLNQIVLTAKLIGGTKTKLTDIMSQGAARRQTKVKINILVVWNHYLHFPYREKYFKDDFAEQPEGTRASEQLERKVSSSIERF